VISDDHAAAIRQRIPDLPKVYNGTDFVAQCTDETSYVAVLLKNDVGNLAAYVPDVIKADKAISDASIQRQDKITAMMSAVEVTELANA
jgi:hypothetical protein